MGLGARKVVPNLVLGYEVSILFCCVMTFTYFYYYSFCRELKWSCGAMLASADNQPAACDIPPFNCPIGPTDRTKGAKTPLQVLKLLTTIILESIVQQTILFANQKGVDFQFCIEELLAINIAMGLLRLPELRDYWCTNGNTMVSLDYVSRSVFAYIEVPTCE